MILIKNQCEIAVTLITDSYLYDKLGLCEILEDETNDSRRVIEGIVSLAKFDFEKKFRKQREDSLS